VWHGRGAAADYAKSDEADAEKGEVPGSGKAVPVVVQPPSPRQVADAVDWRNVWNRDLRSGHPRRYQGYDHIESVWTPLTGVSCGCVWERGAKRTTLPAPLQQLGAEQ
jgi:hypothetical protein